MPGEKITPRITTPALSEVEAALNEYWAALEASELAATTKGIYMVNAENFVRWLKREFIPGLRKDPYPMRKRKKDSAA